MTTARVIIKKALNKIGALVKNENPDNDEANDALDSLNALISSWSNFSANIYSRTRETFPLSSSATYLIGAGQTFNTVLPIQIVEAFYSLGGIDYPLDIINQEAYDSIPFKTITSIPEYLVYNNAYPYGTITLFAVPLTASTITILSEKAIAGFPTLDTVMSLPDGWERALIYNLALELAPEYGQQADPSVIDIAAKSLGAIKIAVVRSRPVEVITNIVSGTNIYSGYPL